MTAQHTTEFLTGGGEMGERIRNFDWSATALGPVETWPRSLRTCVQIMLTSRQPIWIGWGNDLIKLYNDPYISIVKGKHPWALGKPASVVWADIWQDIAPMLQKVMYKNEGTYVEEQLLIMERNGYPEETYYTFSYTPVAGDHGATEGMICFNSDDTERIVSERQLATLTQLSNALNDAKSDRDVFGKAIESIEKNPSDFPFAAIYKFQGETLALTASTGFSSSGALPHEVRLSDASPLANAMRHAIDNRSLDILSGVHELLGETPKGKWNVSSDQAIVLPILQRGQKDAFGFLVTGANPYQLLKGKYLNFFNLVADQIATSLVNVHALEEERKRLEALAEIDKAKTTFFSNISHEFRTPLTLLLGPIEDLLNDHTLDEDKKAKTEVAYRNAHRMQKLVNLLLDFSRIEAGRMEANFQLVDIASLTTDLASSFRSAVEKAGMKLSVSASPLTRAALVDVEMWEKIVLNLLSNAFKYSERGSIDVAVRQSDSAVHVSVSDTGVGIPEHELDNIFKRFHRVQNTRGRSQEGTGIGLAMVKELVKLHNGDISVKSRVGEGSTFTVTLPLAPDLLPAERKNLFANRSRHTDNFYAEEASQWVHNGNGSSKHVQDAKTEKPHTILLADDNADMRSYVQRLIEPHHNVLIAKDGEEAYDLALKHVPDLVLSDIMMPRLDGFGLLAKLKGTMPTRNIPVIFLSARAGEEAKIEGLNAGANDYLVKPFSSRELIARVSAQLATADVRRKTEKQFFNLFLQSPAHIHVFRGPEHVVEFFHPLGISFTGRDITGMKVRETLPQLDGQGFFEMLDSVYHEGKTIQMPNLKATFTDAAGNPRDHFFNTTYLPWRDLDGRVQGVLQFTFEVTETVEQRLKAESSERKFRSIAQQAPVAMSVLRGPRHIVEVANNRLLEMWGKTYEEVIEKSVLDIFPELVDQGFGEILSNVFKTGKPFLANEIPVTFFRYGKSVKVIMNLLYEPFRNENNEIEGIVAVGTDVTEQVEARNRVAEAELKFRTIIEQTPSPLCIFKGKDLVLEVANGPALAVWQATPDVIGKRLADIVPEMSSQVFIRLMQDVYQNGTHRYGFEAPAFFIRENGEREDKFFNFNYVPYRDGDGTITGVLVLATDVTEQVIAKKKLIENEERLTIATDILGLGTWEYDPVKKTILSSPKTIEIFGFKQGSNILLEDAISMISPEDKQRVLAAIQWALNPESKGKYDIEYSVISAHNGQQRIVRAAGQAFFDSDNVPTRFIGSIIDITERKNAENEIRASEERFRLLATTIPQIVWTADANGKTDYLNEQWEIFTGQSVADGVDGFANLIHPEDAPVIIEKWKTAVKTGQAWESEYRLRNTRTNQYRWLFGKCVPLKDENGNVLKWIGSASDIHEFKEQSNWLEQQVQERTKALKELNQSLKISNEDLQQFAHVASHDLKEPIRKIKTFGNRLLDDYQHLLPEKGNSFLTKILSATERMYAMVEGVLSYSTLSASDQPTSPVDLNEVISNIQNDLEVLILEKKATIRYEQLPTIEGAPVLLYQLFYNLINNSIKFSRENVPAVITISSTTAKIEGNNFAKIIVADNGIGFEDEQAEKIFTTFTRLNSKDRYEGTGLGLALCKKIVQRHSGFITAHGERGKGAEFTILLPIK
ncbi:MAG TPA: ATP-binding protein [Chryseosolibacter sp.]